MEIIHQPQALTQRSSQLRSNGRIAFVPTMGNLHQGHLDLVQQAKKSADIVIVSLFVNPMQFGPNEDYATYPRTLEQDIEKLTKLGVDILFVPTADSLYPDGKAAHSKISIGPLAEAFCGASRPGFFDGIATVVLKLFNLVQPHVAVFGQKDYQQTLVIQKLIDDFHLPIELTVVPTARAADGLALSSRNQYLSEVERDKAPLLYQTLQQIKLALKNNARDYIKLKSDAIIQLTTAGFKVDYLDVCTQQLHPPLETETQFTILAAAVLGKTRLIDNLVFGIEA